MMVGRKEEDKQRLNNPLPHTLITFKKIDIYIYKRSHHFFPI